MNAKEKQEVYLNKRALLSEVEQEIAFFMHLFEDKYGKSDGLSCFRTVVDYILQNAADKVKHE